MKEKNDAELELQRAPADLDFKDLEGLMWKTWAYQREMIHHKDKGNIKEQMEMFPWLPKVRLFYSF